MFPSSHVGQYASQSFVTHRYFCTKPPAHQVFIFTTNNFLPPAVGEIREARKVIFVLDNSKEMHTEYQKVSLLKSKHQKVYLNRRIL